jgi:hypothetical protein
MHNTIFPSKTADVKKGDTMAYIQGLDCISHPESQIVCLVAAQIAQDHCMHCRQHQSIPNTQTKKNAKKKLWPLEQKQKTRFEATLTSSTMIFLSPSYKLANNTVQDPEDPIFAVVCQPDTNEGKESHERPLLRARWIRNSLLALLVVIGVVVTVLFLTKTIGATPAASMTTQTLPSVTFNPTPVPTSDTATTTAPPIPEPSPAVPTPPDVSSSGSSCLSTAMTPEEILAFYFFTLFSILRTWMYHVERQSVSTESTTGRTFRLQTEFLPKLDF